MAPILLIVGFVACNPTTPVEIDDPDRPDVSQVNAAGDLRVTERAPYGYVNQDAHVKLTGAGGSNIWNQFRIQIEHDEYESGSNGSFDIESGVFRLVNAQSEVIISGTYFGEGTTDGNDLRHMEQHWTILSASPSVAIGSPELEASLQQQSDGTYRFLLTGAGQDSPSEP